MLAAGIAQSVKRRATGWMTKELEFESQYGQKILLLYVVKPVVGPTQVPLQYVPWAFFPGGKAAGA
jgi:hypothetical protein